MNTHRAAIYDPYLDTLGGGERYCLSVAEILSKHGYLVDIFWSGKKSFLEKAEKRFSLDLKDINIVPDVFGIEPSILENIENKKILKRLIKKTHYPLKHLNKIKDFIQKYKTTRQYDLLFFLSDGSIPFIFAKKNILHIQVPFLKKNINYNPYLNFVKSKIFSNIICNSKFTAKFSQKIFPKNVEVLYPPVDVSKFHPADKKENIILSVGRFDNILNAKRQEILIKAFKKLYPQLQSKWKLILAGGSMVEEEKNTYLSYLKKEAKDFPVEIIVNPPFEELKKIYSISKIYWHAAGYQVKENKNPESTEHFGMTIVEAMASGLIPIVVNKGGIPEIIKNDHNGYLWDKISQLVDYTLSLSKDTQKLEELKNEAIKDSLIYSKENFEKQFLSIINKK